ADTLWRLTGSEVIDMSGPLAVGADIGGRWANPVIRGSLRTQNARLESQATGMVITNIASEARFSGPQLIFSQISGQTPGGGSVAGNGTVTFSGGRNALNLSFAAKQALLLNRDDVAAQVTGPLHIRSDGQSGTISGDLKLNKGRFQLGRASAAAAVPQLNVRETGLEEEDVIEPAQLHPWKLDLRASAQVQGLDASVLVRGTGLRPEITFASTPQLPQDELLSRILFGTSITNLSAPEALQLASAVAALQSGSGSLDPINALRK